MRRTLATGLLGAALVAAPAAFPRAARAEEPGTPPAAATGVAFEHGLTFAQLLGKSKASSKPVFVDFSTEWCGWCKKLDADVFSRADVAAAMTAFVAAHVDAEKDEGVDLAKRYDVHGYPTLLVVDATGEEVDRIVGYEPAPEFIAEVQRIARGEGTLPALRKQVAANPDDFAAGLALAGKERATKPDAAIARYEDVAKRAKAKGDRESEATAVYETAYARLRAAQFAHAEEVLGTFLTDYAGTKAAGRAATAAVQAFSAIYRKQPAALLAALEKVRTHVTDGATKSRLSLVTADAHRALADEEIRAAAKAAGDDAEKLNEVAWWAYEHKTLVKEATAWARKAVDLSKRDPMILDTLASLRALAHAYDEAVALEEEARKGATGGLAKQFEKNVAAWTAAKEGRATADDDDGDDDGPGDDDGEDDDDGAKPDAARPPTPPPNAK